MVENAKSTKEHPHITLSVADGIKAVYSNELLAKAIADGTIEYFDEPIEIEVVEGYSDGQKDIIASE